MSNLRTRHLLHTSLLLLALASGSIAYANDVEPWITGNAYSTENNRLLYQEIHYRSSYNSMVSGRVDYVGPTQEVIVAKTLDYSRSLFTPAIEQNDFRNATKIFTRFTNSGIEVGYQNSEDSPRLNTLERSDRLIIDAGFDSYVREHWDALNNGDTVRGDFLVPARLDTVNIGISSTQRTDCAPLTADALCLVVRPAGLLRLVSWLVEPLYLAYETDTQRLLQYKGISNLLDNDGARQDVIISYQYK